jgi:hypothetical protein
MGATNRPRRIGRGVALPELPMPPEAAHVPARRAASTATADRLLMITG